MDKGFRRLILIGLGITFLAILLSMLREFIIAGIIFIVLVLLGAFGILRLFKR